MKEVVFCKPLCRKAKKAAIRLPISCSIESGYTDCCSCSEQSETYCSSYALGKHRLPTSAEDGVHKDVQDGAQ